MKTGFFLSLFCYSMALAQNNPFPYFVPKNENFNVKYGYIFHDNNTSLSILKLGYNNQLHYLIYNNEGINKSTLISTTYSIQKGKIRINSHNINAYEIIKNDTISFAIEKKGEALKKSRFDIEEIQEKLDGLFFKKGIYYPNKIFGMFNLKAVINPSNDKRLNLSWLVSPFDSTLYIGERCMNPQDLDCLCAALTYQAQSDREKSDAISQFVMDRFKYNRGDTSQGNIQGLVFGKEREAVCEGYSRVYKDLMIRAGVNTAYTTGAVRNSIYDIFYSGYSHAWNQVEIEKEAKVLDITWNDSPGSNWYLKNPEEMFISHFSTGDREKDDIIENKKTMYDFMNQAYISNIEDGAIERLKYIDKTSPIQFAKDKFTIQFSKSLNVSTVSRSSLSYPFVKFEKEKTEISSNNIANTGSVTKKSSTNKLEINLPEVFNNLRVDISGIGTVHYIVINGTERDFYKYFVDNIVSSSPYAVSMAFMACAKLNDEIIFNQLKPYLSNSKLTFKDFVKEAKKCKIDDFKFALFNACRHAGNTFYGYSFEYSNDDNPFKIYVESAKENETYSFKGFASNTFDILH